jgi:hypothetical protein
VLPISVCSLSVSPTGSRDHRAIRPKADHALTFKLDLSRGADQSHSINSCKRYGREIRMNRVAAFLICIFASGFLTACEDDDTLPFSEYEKVQVNVYFYFPDDREMYLGETKGASSCGNIAYSYAQSKGMSRSDNWSYICCTIEKGSSCYRKIR